MPYDSNVFYNDVFLSLFKIGNVYTKNGFCF